VRVLVAEAARADVRRIGQAEAIRILRSIGEFAKSGQGDVRALAGPYAGKFRLRIGNYRMIFRKTPEQEMLVLRVLHRGAAY
jgi:mRNA-degrading endonuclease RelE of RelBE toxin-antitoxin system